jgi:hypothetical protein
VTDDIDRRFPRHAVEPAAGAGDSGDRPSAGRVHELRPGARPGATPVTDGGPFLFEEARVPIETSLRC